VSGEWPDRRFDAVFSANTLHIMGWEEVERLFARLPDVMAGRAGLTLAEDRARPSNNRCLVWRRERRK
jgi:cyclopropane fatty-acyl-phospholipid synthase-like methyltransferase